MFRIEPSDRDQPGRAVAHDGSAQSGRRERRRQETRDDIVRVARQIVMASGAEHVTVREIARRADFAPSALYRYFEGGRPEILLALARASVGVLEGHLATVPKGLPPAERIVAMGEAYLRFAREHPEEVALLFDSLQAMEPLDLEHPDETFLAPTGVYRLLESALREGIAEGVFRIAEEDLMLVMHGAWALVHGLALVERLHVQHGGVFDDRGRDLIRAFVNGLGSEWDAGPRRSAT
jgi:AcrR family transcriptional regulator